MNILLLGKNGQVGWELQRALLPLGKVIALSRSEVDLENLDKLQSMLAQHSPDIIVNAAAYTAVDRAETDEVSAYKVNAQAVDVMACYARTNESLLVHYSTDYVFDGEKEASYGEDDHCHPLSVYGCSKRVGEEAILQKECRALVFRTSWVFSAHGSNFIKTILRLARERETLGVIDDQYGAPTSAEFIADVTALGIFGHNKALLPSGVYHLTATGRTTWYALACYIVQRALNQGVHLRLKPECIKPITTQDYPLPAKRPKNSCLDTSKLEGALGLRFPEWQVYVDRVIDHLNRLGFFV